MASAWAGMGSTVTLLAQTDGLLPRMEPFAGELIGRAFSDAGIDVRIGVTVTGIRRPTPSPPTAARWRRCSSAPPRPGPSGSPPTRPNAPAPIRVIDVHPGQTVPGAGLYADGYTGRARAVIDEDHGYLLGVTFVGPGVEELIYSATIAVAGSPHHRLWHAVPCFPSISEVWLRLLEAYRN